MFKEGATEQQSFASVFVDEHFINKAQFSAGFAHHLILKNGAVPAIKDPGHDSELQTLSEMARKVLTQTLIFSPCLCHQLLQVLSNMLAKKNNKNCL